MKRNKTRNLLARLAFGNLRVLRDALFDFIECFIGYVVSQHIMNETLFNGLAHGIEVKRLERAIRFLSAESLHSLWLRRCSKRKEGNIRLVTTFRNCFYHTL